jgi:hypothetical protein
MDRAIVWCLLILWTVAVWFLAGIGLWTLLPRFPSLPL